MFVCLLLACLFYIYIFVCSFVRLLACSCVWVSVCLCLCVCACVCAVSGWAEYRKYSILTNDTSRDLETIV